MSESLVSIIVPCYNQAHYLDETLQSVLNQSYRNWECIIVDDGSPDNTHEIAKKWCDIDSRFKYYHKENGGLSSARNFGLDFVKGDYIQFLDSDDCLDKLKLENSLQSFNSLKNKDLRIVISNFKMFDEDINTLSSPYCDLKAELFNLESILYQWEDSFTIPIHCGIFESSLFQNFRFPENLRAKEDWVMWVSLFQKTNKIFFKDESLAYYRRNPKSMTKNENLFPEFIKAIEYLETILTPKEYNRLSVVLISRFYKSSLDYRYKLALCKDSNTYKLGLFFKKMALKIGVLPFFKKIFQRLISFKFISNRL
ncbi:glycosyltransferase family 2 protein [Flavobacterium sp. N502536]|uniref:glycosyltransferase family 2 protein n=1 Tax=Flavobacterium sp. N502536 TaxID=2986837 RepID=UPI0022216F0D|nr:glycosyltransferase family 2 protein [Flavobacterium sp. N502536]